MKLRVAKKVLRAVFDHMAEPERAAVRESTWERAWFRYQAWVGWPRPRAHGRWLRHGRWDFVRPGMVVRVMSGGARLERSGATMAGRPGVAPEGTRQESAPASGQGRLAPGRTYPAGKG